MSRRFAVAVPGRVRKVIGGGKDLSFSHRYTASLVDQASPATRARLVGACNPLGFSLCTPCLAGLGRGGTAPPPLPRSVTLTLILTLTLTTERTRSSRFKSAR